MAVVLMSRAKRVSLGKSLYIIGLEAIDDKMTRKQYTYRNI